MEATVQDTEAQGTAELESYGNSSTSLKPTDETNRAHFPKRVITDDTLATPTDDPMDKEFSEEKFTGIGSIHGISYHSGWLHYL
ncbi:hypothetical protein EYC84_009300 [Monilinia fructicola]|uniref:Uncharacterized protein n=1 Tax=Monilinia fructicola TaxID=38448 RepID=A0A5M9JA44_MONFR|nr:hypothetical protein EYC84_009300 [Monilinia fructicola]